MREAAEAGVRNLVVILGDQLDRQSAAFDGFDRERDAVWMAEAASEANAVWSHKARIVYFLAAMRHFRDELEGRRMRVCYLELEQEGNPGTLEGALEQSCREMKPERVILVEPGEVRVERLLKEAAKRAGVPVEVRRDRHFLASDDEFAEHAEGRKQLRLEYFYREMRRRAGVLMEAGGKPAGGRWNFDAENRLGFGRKGPGRVEAPRGFSPDAVTRGVMEMVERRFAGHPGTLKNFDWPVTAEQAGEALEDFLDQRLSRFGQYQDAMWTGEPYLYHSRLSASMNLKLLDPRAALRGAEERFRRGEAPIQAVEGFARQILGWREYVRGIYRRFIPGYAERNALGASGTLPAFYWTGETDMACLRAAVTQTLDYGYAHHIQRLMVTGLYALLLGVEPKQVHEWYLAVYVDAVEWVELPNVIGMSQFADGGVMASKPYAASGNYISRMSNYCGSCRYDPRRASGEGACPVTTLYWDFLMRHEEFLRGVGRMEMQLRNLERMAAGERAAVRRQAGRVRGD